MRVLFVLIVLFLLPLPILWILDVDRYAWLPTEKDFRLAAANAQVEIGGASLVIPLVAIEHHGLGHGPDDSRRKRQMRDAQRAKFRRASADPSRPVGLDRAVLTFAAYGTLLETPRAAAVCPGLQRDWARALCRNASAPLRQVLPERLILLDLATLGDQPGWTTVGGESMWDQVAGMTLAPGETSVVCDREQTSSTLFCSAATPLEKELVAVWTVWNGSEETAGEMAARLGKGVRAFHAHLLKPEENFALFERLACGWMRPEGGNWPPPEVCAEG